MLWWQKVAETLQSEEQRNKFLSDVAAGALVITTIYMITVFGWQIFFWLKHDIWINCDLLTILTDKASREFGPRKYIVPYLGDALPELSGWLKFPTEWFGLHKVITSIFRFISFPVALFVSAFLFQFFIEENTRQS